MTKPKIAFFFCILFASLTIVPSILALTVDNFDLAFIIDSNEEEEKNGEEKSKNFEVEVTHISDYLSSLMNSELSTIVCAYSENYTSFAKELSPPPPEQNI